MVSLGAWSIETLVGFSIPVAHPSAPYRTVKLIRITPAARAKPGPPISSKAHVFGRFSKSSFARRCRISVSDETSFGGAGALYGEERCLRKECPPYLTDGVRQA
jgi:hypothetical protein